VTGRGIGTGGGRVLALLAGFAAAAPALAGEPGAEGGLSPFSGDLGNAIWTLLTFGLVVFVLGRYAWKPILNGLGQREQFIRSALEQAQRDREEAEAHLRDYNEKLIAARAEATAIVEEARRDAETVKHRLEEEANAEAEKIIERARREIGIARQTAVKDLYAVAARLTTDLAGRILEREIRPQDHERLIRDSIARLSSAEAGGSAAETRREGN
jgi:F-type H+-transporting ATPase subunit b